MFGHSTWRLFQHAFKTTPMLTNEVFINDMFMKLTVHSLSAVLNKATKLSRFVYNENPRMPCSWAPVSTRYRGSASSPNLSNLSFIPKDSPEAHFSGLITQSSGSICATAWESCPSKVKPPSDTVISPWVIRSGFPGISCVDGEFGWRAWKMILLSESLSARCEWSPGIRLSFTDSIDHEWTGLIEGAAEKRIQN